jgi:hypothetical protein
MLHVPFGNESCLVSDDVAMFITFQLENPFQSDGAVSLWQVHQRPCHVLFN